MRIINPHLVCKDGTRLSVQANESAYCTPRENVGPYTEFEVKLYGNDLPDTWNEYAEFDGSNLYAYLPVTLIQEFIDAHGGIDISKTITKALGFKTETKL